MKYMTKIAGGTVVRRFFPAFLAWSAPFEASPEANSITLPLACSSSRWFYRRCERRAVAVENMSKAKGLNLLSVQCEAPKMAKLVYNSNNYSLWHL